MRFVRRGRGSDESPPVEPAPVTRVEPAKPRPVDPDPVEPDQPVVSARAESAPAATEPVGPVPEQAAAGAARVAAPVESAPAPPKPVAHDLSSVEAELAEADPDVTPDDALAIETESAHLVAVAEAAADATAVAAGDRVAAIQADARIGAPDADGEPAPVRPARGPVLSWPGSTAEAAGGLAAEDRPPALRFARLHLRSGQYALARAELEALAGRGRLDGPALLDLAEIRWRTGDLQGAGEAAKALVAGGSESPLALVIAAEAVAAAGRPGEARRLSSRALDVADAPLGELFAGMPRSTIWPAAPESETPAAAPRGRSTTTADTFRAPSTASEAFAGGRAALVRGDSTRAALLLSVAMRLAPEFAEDVLHSVAGRDDHPLLALVRGDALRLLGQEAEALEAFDRARGRASSAVSGSLRRGDPGLFDDDPALSGDQEA